ncbi:MAG: hypothetical protein HYR63_11440 [Proteobacteria bacterium]|nr:hypothetical protein [Pseudomonadota bacterium]MBI3496329.1 hypothetical protein [Pseudomonadota bacterium]
MPDRPRCRPKGIDAHASLRPGRAPTHGEVEHCAEQRQAPGKRQSISAASTVSGKGAIWFATYKGGMSADLFVAMLKQVASSELLQERFEADLIGIQNNRALVRSFFKAPYFAYIADR